jgi:PAS domain S-box-containing protein
MKKSHDLRQSEESEARYRGLLEAAPDAMVVVNQGGEIVLLNAQAEKQFGYSRDELLGRKVKSIIPEGFAERLIADGARSAAEALAQQIGTGIELSGRRKDGSEFPIEIMLSPLESAEGILVTAAIRNISVRQAAEKRLAQMEHRRQLGEDALRESEERYRMLLDGVRDYAIFMMDPEGRIISWNAGAEHIKGYTGDQIIGHNFSCFFPPEDIERGQPQEVLRRTAASGRHEEQGMRVRQDGSRFLASVTLTALRDPTGKLRGFCEFSHDLSERKASEAKYRGLLEAAPDAMVVVNQGGEIVLLNVQAEKQFGYNRDELLGLKVKNIIPEGFAERLIADGTRSAAEALAQQIGTGLELSGRRKDGSEFPIEIMLSPLESAEGILVTAAIRNISVRKDAEKHLAQMEGRYRGLLEAAPDAMVVVNQSGEIVLLNVQAEKQFGYRRDELLRQKVKSIIPEGFAERLIADGTRSAAEALAQQIGTGLELSGRRKDGSEFPIEIMLSPLESAEGILVTAAIRDISARKRAEEALRRSDESYRLIVSNVKDYAMFMLDTTGLVVTWNDGAEKIKGFKADEIIGQNFSRFYTAEDISNGKPAFGLEQAATHQRYEVEGWRVRKDGSRYFADVVITALRDSTGQLRGFGKIIRDITERKKAEQRLAKTVADLKRSNEELQQFAYVASHDLQEPLRMVASYTQLLAKRYQGRLDADADEFIAFAVDGCNRMRGLIQDLLTYSRAGTGGKSLIEISAEDALQEALMNLQATIEQSGAVVSHDSLPVILTDGAQLVQVFQNLVGNAIKYRSAEVPRVHVSATVSGTMNGSPEWVFSVRDNGLGIDPKYSERVFILFQRLHLQTEFEGTGIGLAICKKIVERLGGRIWVESQLGKGSTFYFALPERK